MSDDLVKRLRDMCGNNGILAIRDIYDGDVVEAADRIEKLEAALRYIERHAGNTNIWYAKIVRKALEGKDE